MEDRRGRGRGLEAAALVLAVVAIPLTAFVVLEVVAGFDPIRVTRRTAVAGLLLAIGAIALPAVILSRWQSARRSIREDATRDRRR